MYNAFMYNVYYCINMDSTHCKVTKLSCRTVAQQALITIGYLVKS